VPIEIPDIFKTYGGFFGRGLVASMAPEIVKGMLIEMLKTRTVKATTRWVEQNVILWDTLEPSQKQGLRRLSEMSNLDWLDAEWIIAAIKQDCPSLASLFLGWRKGKNWLVRQVEIIKKEVAKA